MIFRFLFLLLTFTLALTSLPYPPPFPLLSCQQPGLFSDGQRVVIPANLTVNGVDVLQTLSQQQKLISQLQQNVISLQNSLSSLLLTVNTNIPVGNLIPRTFNSSVASAGNIALSADCGIFSTASNAFITNMVATLETTGRMVMVLIVPSDSLPGSNAAAMSSVTKSFELQLYRNGTAISKVEYHGADSSGNYQYYGASAIFVDTPPAGTFQYTMYAVPLSGATLELDYLRLLAYEV